MPDLCRRCSAELAPAANYCARCGAVTAASAAPDPADPLLGSVLLGRYRIVRKLGEGGMGQVYLAEQSMGQATRPVALKALRKELMGDPKVGARFLRESEIVIQLSHPNTIQFHDFGQLDDGTLVIVMEYVEGRTLADELRSGPLPLTRVDRLMTQICGSLAEAHARTIVHRDLKPQNVLLTTRAGHSDFVKVVDFGIALRRGDEEQEATRLTTQGTLIGTPPYMSPEQFQDRPVDARSDVYSLGIMLFEMVTGELPFAAKSPWQWAAAHIEQAPRPIGEHPRGRDLPAARARAVMRALEKDPDRRPRDAGELLNEWLSAAAAESPAVATGPVPLEARPSQPEVFLAPTLRAATPPARGRRFSSWLAVGVVVAAAIAFSMQDLFASSAEPGPHGQVRTTVRPTRDRTRPGSRRANHERAEQREHATGEVDDAPPDLAPEAPPSPTADVGAAVASARAALHLQEVTAAAEALRRASALQDDHPELPELRRRLSTIAERRAEALKDRSDCGEAASLAEALQRASVTLPTVLSTALEACAAPVNSRGDAGPSSVLAP